MSLKRWLLLALIGFSFFSFLSLGFWQLERREWKLGLIDQVEQQFNRLPVIAPGPGEWGKLSERNAYQPLIVRGRFLHDAETQVQAMTSYGSGYWLLTPLETDRGFFVLVNRGFVDSAHRLPASRELSQTTGPVEVRGLLRLTEPEGRIWQANQPSEERWYSRDVEAIGEARRLSDRLLAPYFIDADHRENPGGWPVGGLTVLKFRNAHLGYALTWFGLSLLCLVCGGIVLKTEMKQRFRG